MSIEVSGLTVRYGSVTAVEEVDLLIRSGEVTGLVGMNGSGKSTLFKAIMGMVAPSAGGVLMDGSDPARARRRGLVGYVPQSEDVDWSFPVCVRDVVMMGRYGHQGLTRRPRRADHEAVAGALERVGLTDLAGRQIGQLSGGQKRRVAIAGVLAMEPEVLILDEPTAGLDPRGRDEILDVIKGLHDQRGMTIILVSHSMEDVARYAGRLIVMNRGSKVFDGTPKEVFRHYKELEAIGLAAPQITYLVHDLREQGVELDPDITTIEEARKAILELWEGADGAGAPEHEADGQAKAGTVGKESSGDIHV